MLAGDVVLEFGGESFLGGEAERAGLILLAAMLLSFLFIRTSARLMRSPKVPWWPGSVTTEAALIGGLVLMGFLPFATDAGVPTIVASVLGALGLATMAVLKGKLFMGVATMLVPFVGLVAALRLAKPDSFWARRRYPEGSRKLARARARLERHQRRYRAFQDRIAGAPD
jgi:hypothetical protein